MTSYVGMVPLGETLRVYVLTADGSHQPVAPDAAPTWKVYGPSGFMAGMTGTCVQASDGSPVVGFYYASIPATGPNGFEAGEQYTVLFSWAVSTASRASAASFGVI